jgi:hypothetical protein
MTKGSQCERKKEAQRNEGKKRIPKGERIEP